MMCVAMDFAGTDNRFYSSHSKGHVFSSHPTPQRKFKYGPWFTHINTLIKYYYWYFQGENSLISVVTLATSNIVFKYSNHDLRIRKYFTKAKHVRFMLHVHCITLHMVNIIMFILDGYHGNKQYYHITTILSNTLYLLACSWIKKSCNKRVLEIVGILPILPRFSDLMIAIL